MASFRQVVALSRGLEILRLINQEGRSSVSSLHAKTDLDKATIVRMLETLESQGYVLRDPNGPSYVPSGKVMQLAKGYVAHVEVGRRAGPVLARFRQALRWPANLAIFDGDAMVIAETAHDVRSMVVAREPGYRFPLLSTSLGLAYFANMPAATRAAIVDMLARNPVGWNWRAVNRDDLEAQAALIRRQGYALAEPNYLRATFGDELWGISVAVKGTTEVYGALGLMVLRRVLPPEDGIAELLPPLQQAAPEIALALGG